MFVSKKKYNQLLEDFNNLQEKIENLSQSIGQFNDPGFFVRTKFLGTQGIEGYEYSQLSSDEQQQYLYAVKNWVSSIAWKKEYQDLLNQLNTAIYSVDLGPEQMDVLKRLVVFVESLNDRWLGVAADYDSRPNKAERWTDVEKDDVAGEGPLL